MKKIILIVGVVIGASAALYWFLMSRVVFAPTQPFESVAPLSEADVTVIAEDLTIPWEIAWLPEGDILVTERPGQLVRIGADRQVTEVSGVHHVGEGGLLGMALHPDFADTSFIYLYLTTKQDGTVTNRVERYRLSGAQLEDPTVIIENIPGSTFHDGGRIAFGPDKMLYITTGDAGQRDSAQSTTSLAGKILRLNDDGSIPADNPFNSAIYSYGHRNPQGLAWDDNGQLWATEHGQSSLDELNRIEKGANYGWPTIEGDQQQGDMVVPVVHSGAGTTWAPSGLVFQDGVLWLAGLRGQGLYSYAINEVNPTVKTHLGGVYGRLRTVAVGPDGFFYILTNNRDGRGNPKSGDDKIIRLNPAAL